MNKTRLLPGTLLFGTLIVLGPAAIPAPALTPPDVVAIPATGTLDCVACAEHCEDGYHDAWDSLYPSVEEWDRAGGVHPIENPCWSGTCDTKHGPCTETAPDAVTNADIETLRSYVLSGDEAALLATIRAHKEQIAVNTERLAIQVKNCTGLVVVHMPITKAVALSLATAQEN